MEALLTHVLRDADRALVLAQRLLQQITHAPEIEEDMALANLALDLIGQARVLYTYAGEIEGLGHDEDHFAHWRAPEEFLHPRLVEQPNTDFAHVIVRQYLHDAYALLYWQAMVDSVDATLAALAAKSQKETAYHVRHSRGWVLRLGDGTDESHRRMQVALDRLLPFSGDMFRYGRDEEQLVADDVTPHPIELVNQWFPLVQGTFVEATLAVHQEGVVVVGGPDPGHADDFVDLITEMQGLARAHPGATW